MNNPVLDAIHNRRSIRKYKADMPSKEIIQELVKAALISPSSMNQQAWHLTVLTNQELILEWEKDIVQYFIDMKKDSISERIRSRKNKIFYDAPLVFVISMEEDKSMDVGIMAQSIALAAKSIGLDSVILGLPRVAFDPIYENKWHEKLAFPDNHVYGISVAVGYGDAPGIEREIDRSKVTYIE